MTADVFVVGTGYLGQRCLNRLPGAVGLSRSSGFDLDGSPGLPQVPPPDYSVIYTVPPAQDGKSDTRLGRMISLLEPPPAGFVYISTTGVYGDCHGEPVDENRPVNPESSRAALRVDAEQQLRSWCEDRGVRLVILRAPGIYGPGRLGIERIRGGAPNIRESEANPGNRIHVDDLASCCLAALRDRTPAGIYNVGDGDFRSATWFAGEVARQAGMAPPPQISFRQAQQEFTPMRMSFLRESRRIDTRKMREVLGVTPTYSDPVDGIAASLRNEN